MDLKVKSLILQYYKVHFIKVINLTSALSLITLKWLLIEVILYYLQVPFIKNILLRMFHRRKFCLFISYWWKSLGLSFTLNFGNFMVWAKTVEQICYLQMKSFEKLCTVLRSGGIWPEGKSWSYTWLFWCSVLWSAG